MEEKIGTVQISGLITPEGIVVEPVRNGIVTIDKEQEEIYFPCSKRKTGAIYIKVPRKRKGIKKLVEISMTLNDFREWAEKNHKDYQIVFA